MSDLDSNLKREVQRSLESMDRDYLKVAIAHRLSSVQNADRIFTVEDGEITESRTHQQLLDEGGTYAELHGIRQS